MEELIATIVSEYGAQIWFAFITFVITGFVLTLMKNLVQDLVYYYRARMSDIGRGQRIYFRGEIFQIDKITYRYIEAHDDRRFVLIPIKDYMEGVREYPIGRHDDFDEDKYHQKPWDGQTERRKDT
jgi:hypothetical protein